MSDIMDETKIFINDVLTHDLGDRKRVLLTHGCMCGFKVDMSWPSNPEAGITAGSKTIDTRLTPMLYDREHYPYPKDAKFYSGVLSYATAFWLGHEQFSKNTKYDTNDILRSTVNNIYTDIASNKNKSKFLLTNKFNIVPVDSDKYIDIYKDKSIDAISSDLYNKYIDNTNVYKSLENNINNYLRDMYK